MNLSQLTPNLKLLRLSGILDTLEIRNQQAIREQGSYEEFLTRLLQQRVLPARLSLDAATLRRLLTQERAARQDLT